MGEEAVINYQLAIKKAKQAADENECDRAIKLCEKALRIMNTKEASELLLTFKSAKANNNVNSPPNVKRPAPPPPPPNTTKNNSLPKKSSNIKDNNNNETSSPRPATRYSQETKNSTSNKQPTSSQPSSPSLSNPSTPPPPLPKTDPVATSLADKKPKKSPPPIPSSENESSSLISKVLALKSEMESSPSTPSKPYLYELLNLPSENYTEISSSQIKKSYFKMSKLIHPDKQQKNTDQSEEELNSVLEAFKTVKNAYETLIDEESRNYYHYDLENPEGAEKYLEENDPRPQHVETYTRADGWIYSGEINRSGQAHGFGTLQFDPKKHNFKQITDETGHLKTLKILPTSELAELERTVTRCVSSNFVNDEIIEKEIVMEFIVPNSSDMNYKGGFKFSEGSNFILRHGTGKMRYPDGSSYEGTWYNDFFHTQEVNKAIYSEDEFFSEDEEKDKPPTIKETPIPSIFCNKSDSSKYIGEFKYGFKCGSGIMRFFRNSTTPNSSYTGGFKRDAFSGYGTFVNEERQYDGQWVDGKYHGFGRLRMFANSSNGRMIKLHQPTDLEGTFKDSHPHGKNMTYHVPGHGTFIGEYNMGQKGDGQVKK